jgi:hypothetical protein
MLGGASAKPDAEPAVHHLDDADNYLQVCNVFNFMKILLNCIPNDFCIKGTLRTVHRRRHFLVPPHRAIHRPHTSTCHR